MSSPGTRVIVRALILNAAGHIFLVQEADDKEWSLPGGYADNWDIIGELRREISEETGYPSTIHELLLVGSNTPHYGRRYMQLIYHARINTSEPPHATDTDIINSGWFPLHELPPLSERISEDNIVFAHHVLHDQVRTPITVSSVQLADNGTDTRVHLRR